MALKGLIQMALTGNVEAPVDPEDTSAITPAADIAALQQAQLDKQDAERAAEGTVEDRGQLWAAMQYKQFDAALKEHVVKNPKAENYHFHVLGIPQVPAIAKDADADTAAAHAAAVDAYDESVAFREAAVSWMEKVLSGAGYTTERVSANLTEGGAVTDNLALSVRWA